MPDGLPETMIAVRFQVEGWHRWPGAKGPRAYLADRHRHLWHVEAQVQVLHNDREVELHDFRDFCIAHFPAGDAGDASCEALAAGLVNDITRRYGRSRRVRVSVFEDGENGAVLSL
jgi:hypothetical protein